MGPALDQLSTWRFLHPLVLKPSPWPHAHGASLAESHCQHFGFHLQLPLGTHQLLEECPSPEMIAGSSFLCQLLLIARTCLGFSVWKVVSSGGQDHLALTAQVQGAKEAACMWCPSPSLQRRTLRPLWERTGHMENKK